MYFPASHVWLPKGIGKQETKNGWIFGYLDQKLSKAFLPLFGTTDDNVIFSFSVAIENFGVTNFEAPKILCILSLNPKSNEYGWFLTCASGFWTPTDFKHIMLFQKKSWHNPFPIWLTPFLVGDIPIYPRWLNWQFLIIFIIYWLYDHPRFSMVWIWLNHTDPLNSWWY